jgi:DNA ligase (NAD+)
MYSLEKFYKGESTQSPLKKELLVQSPKLDGAAIALIYAKGGLVATLTRGDGQIGKDISHLIPAIKVPKIIDLSCWDVPPTIVQISLEVVAPITVSNPRNYAAGALGLKDINEFKTRELMYFVHGVQPYITETYSEDLLTLQHLDFNTVNNADTKKYPTDGIVFRIDNNESFENLGYTSSHPRGAYALKTRSIGVVTTLNNVIWQVGKSGIVSPVAILEPIKIGDATISRATLHNMSYINNLNLEIGCKVEVIRSGEIIPRIVRRVE